MEAIGVIRSKFSIILCFIVLEADAPGLRFCLAAPEEAVPSETRDEESNLGESESRLSDIPIGLQPIPEAPRLLIEWPDPFLKVGELNRGLELPTGAVWRPSLLFWGTYRTALQIFNNQRGRQSERSEWAQRLDLFGQLNLSGTERLVIGVNPFREERRTGPNRAEFVSYDFRNDDFVDAWNGDVLTLFFEGDFGELFPSLDSDDTSYLDIGFSVGRQPLSIQDGLLINETSIEAATITRNTLYGNGLLNLRVTGMVAWDEINRNDNRFDSSANLFGLFTETDLSFATVNVDAAYVDADSDTGSSLHLGASSIQRIHLFGYSFNTSFHGLGSILTDHDNPNPAVDEGALLFSQISTTPHHTVDLLYMNTFWAIDNFTSAARGPGFGGPLGQAGITFASVGLGRYLAPLSNQASRAFGGAIGYQFIFDETRKQLIVELGGRKDTNEINEGEFVVASRYQQALWQHLIFRVEGFVGAREGVDDLLGGARSELLIKF